MESARLLQSIFGFETVSNPDRSMEVPWFFSDLQLHEWMLRLTWRGVWRQVAEDVHRSGSESSNCNLQDVKQSPLWVLVGFLLSSLVWCESPSPDRKLSSPFPCAESCRGSGARLAVGAVSGGTTSCRAQSERNFPIYFGPIQHKCTNGNPQKFGVFTCNMCMYLPLKSMLPCCHVLYWFIWHWWVKPPQSLLHADVSWCFGVRYGSVMTRWILERSNLWMDPSFENMKTGAGFWTKAYERSHFSR